ncbi:uncharacterized protein A1O5_12637 [Cladophialophora psammophila CBS 110553]|uniref:FAD-binding domain-containing protein n=1 Tax=Cladophialophora psammophila CBS 110553 TaxID=1182543 RepID=W9VTN4_9EURO|nr:uncharacterized protein A1O5_12637 [Cladophialophora psammophila CBS 110553]EXJ56370.1 hypothetical protein A1O5_12637 [Cladophialophora psammophila CBS 110553]
MNVELDKIEIPDYPSGSYNFVRRLRKEKELSFPTPIKSKLSRKPAAPTTNTSETRISNGTNGTTDHPWAKLKVAIIGAGVGGLSNAIALTRMGHEVSIYEQASALSEVGAGIQIPPNSTRILHSWGLGPALQRRSVKPTALLWRRWEDGSIIGKAKLNPESEQRFGSPYYVTHRAHLHEVLHDRTVELGVPVYLSKRVQKYDTQNGEVTFDDGNLIKADLIVAADGLKSTARRELNSAKDKGPWGHGLSAYRGTIAVADMRADPLTKWIVEQPNLHLWVGHDLHVMSYAIAGGERFNLVVTHPQNPKEATEQPLSRILEEMRSHYVGWDPCLRRLLEMVTSTIDWPINCIDIPDTWSSESGKLLITGDAAHAMVPYMALGAAMAVEDAAALAATLKHVKSKEDLPAAMSKWEESRKPRVKKVHAASYGHGLILHLPDGPVQRARDEAMKAELEGAEVKESPNQWSDPVLTEWAYGHDPEAEIDQLWSAGEGQP